MRETVLFLAVSALLCASPLAGAQTPEEALLRASNAGSGDEFGGSVAISGDRAVVGARYEDGPSDDRDNIGAAYVFERVEGTWKEVQVLRASNADSGDRFGCSVAIDGDRAIVGAYGEGGPSNDTADAGAVYVFERTENGWPQHEDEILRASNAEPNALFGYSVAIGGPRAIVGAQGVSAPSGNAWKAGAAYVFERTEEGWSQYEDGILRASNTGDNDEFGISVAIDGRRAIVGAWEEDGPSNSIVKAGAAYVFERTEDGWRPHEDAILRATDAGAGDQFGGSVAIDGTRMVVGAWGEPLPPNNKDGAGAVYVFERTGDNWSSQILRASNGEAEDQFGRSVAISDDRVVVGAPQEEGPSDDNDFAGATYVFARTEDGWVPREDPILRLSNADAKDKFGISVAIDGNRTLVGAPFKKAPWDDNGAVGAASVFDLSSDE